MVENMVSLVLVDALMQQKAHCELFPFDKDNDDEPPAPLGMTASRGEEWDGTIERLKFDKKGQKEVGLNVDEE